MPRVTVTVAGTEAPKPGKVRGRIKDTNSIIYQIPPALMPMVRIGSTYEIDYKDDDYNGNQFRVIESLVEAMSGMPSAPPSRIPAPSRPYTNASAGMVPSAPTTKDEDIAALAILKCVKPIEAERGAIAAALMECALGWRNFKKWQKTQGSDMDGDENPY